MDDESLRRELRHLREQVADLERRLEALEDGGDDESDEVASRTPGESIDDEHARAPAGESESAGGSGVDRSDDDGELPESNADQRNWELAVGVRWFGLAGALALVIGVVLFVRLAVETGILGPLGRVAVGTAGGAALFVGGRYAAVRQGYVRWGRIAAGAGLAVAYFSLYAAYGFETYREAIDTPLWAVLLALTGLVAVTAFVSVRDGAPLVVGEAFLLGYVTASLSIDAATLVVTPAYVLLLASGLVAIATVRPWSRPVVSSVFATYGVLALWRFDVHPPAAAATVVTVIAFGLYLLGGDVLRGSDRTTDRTYRVQLAALTVGNAVAAALFLESSVRDWFPDAPVEGGGLIFVALALAGAYAVVTRRDRSRRDEVSAAGSVVFLVGGLQMALEPFATTVVAMLVVCAAVVLSTDRLTEGVGFRVGAHVVAAALVTKLLAVDSTLPAFDVGEPVATLTGRPASFALAIGVFYGLARWLSLHEDSVTAVERDVGPTIGGAYAIAATGLAVILLGLELSGTGLSVVWALFGFALLGYGLSTDAFGVRLLGIAVLVLAIGKVFLIDTSDLDTVARMISFLVLGAVLLAASYSYARLRGGEEFEFDVVPDRE